MNIINDRVENQALYITQNIGDGVIGVWATRPQDARCMVQQHLGWKRLPNGFTVKRSKAFL